MGLENRVVVITGASGGLGQVITQFMVEAGARVVLLGRTLEKLKILAGDLDLPEDRYLAQAVDLSDPAAAKSAADTILEKFGKMRWPMKI